MTSAEILAELRATAPPAPDPLRDRVRTIVASESRRRRPAFTPRRVSFALVGALLVAALGAAFVGGLTSSGEKKSATGTVANFHSEALAPVLSAPTVRKSPAATRSWKAAQAAGAARAAADQQALKAFTPSALPPAGLRLQDYDVQLGVRVADAAALSKATVAAMRWTRANGGYVAKVSYDTPKTGARGDSVLVLRVPVAKVQDAMQRFARLGSLTSQHVAIQDLQGTVNAQTKRIITLNRSIAAILKQLQMTQTVDRTAQLQAQLAAARQELAAVRTAKRATVVQGRLAHVYLTLTTKAAKKHAVAPPARPGRIQRGLDDAGTLLAKEVAVLLYGLVVLAPFLLIAAALFLAARAMRRRTDRRLLARS